MICACGIKGRTCIAEHVNNVEIGKTVRSKEAVQIRHYYSGNLVGSNFSKKTLKHGGCFHVRPRNVDDVVNADQVEVVPKHNCLDCRALPWNSGPIFTALLFGAHSHQADNPLHSMSSTNFLAIV